MVTRTVHHSRASHYLLIVLAMEPEGSSMLGKYSSLSDIPALYRMFLVLLVTDVALPWGKAPDFGVFMELPKNKPHPP